MSEPIAFETLEVTLQDILSSGKYHPQVDLKRIRKKLEKKLNLPKDSLKDSQDAIGGYISVRICAW